MKENNNKTNIVLLTVIGIATLLVAVVGATFAYFTAQIGGNPETTPTIQVGAGTLTIAYAGGTNDLVLSEELTGTSVVPQDDAIITKGFTITGNNSTESVMPYTLSLEVTENEFTDGALTYKLTNNGGNGVLAAKTGSIQNDGSVDGDGTFTPADGTAFSIPFCGGKDDQNNDITDCSFSGIVTNEKHQYKLEVFFLNKETENQDADKNKNFKAYIKVGVEAAYTTTT